MRRTGVVALLVLAIVSEASAKGGPPVVSPNPPGVGMGPVAQPIKPTYGLCSGPQNPDALATSPIPVSEDNCRFYQTFKATSPTAKYGSSCGGYAVTFGPSGGLDHTLTDIMLSADWGDTPPTAATCADSRVAAVGWGYRCSDATCTTGAWEVIGGPSSRKGAWNAISQVCYLELGWSAGGTVYTTLSVDVIATQKQGATS